MKIIDLLNKIANGEEVPKKIKWEDTIFAYSDYDKDYLEFPFSEEEYQGLFCMKDSILTQYLNDEVEIIEDNKIEYYEGLIENDTFQYVTTKTYNKAQHTIQKKINEIIDYLNSKGE